MGQRLVISISRNDKLLATVYYHWGAYSTDAIQYLYDLYHSSLEDAAVMTDDELKLQIIRYAEKNDIFGFETNPKIKLAAAAQVLEKNSMQSFFVKDVWNGHGGISSDEFELVCKMFPNETFNLEGLDRNRGLVNISKDGMQRSLSYAEGLIEVNLTDETVFFNVASRMSREDFLNFEDGIKEEDLELLPVLNKDITSFKIDEIKLVKFVIESRPSDIVKYKDDIIVFVS